MSSIARVALSKNLARAVRSGHPWIFRDAVRPGPTLEDGHLVLVTTRDGRPLGRGFWTATSPIAVRMLTTDPHDDISLLVEARLRDALNRRLAFLDRERTNAFRWLHGEADLLPGLHLDVYGTCASLRFDGPGARAFYLGLPCDLPRAIVAAGVPIGLETLLERGARRGDGSPNGESSRESAAVLAGPPPAQDVEILENGLRFGVDLAHGQKGGLFLDQRDNRERVRGLARDRSVLNLFGYTGGFSVYAAAGGARGSTTVDSAPAAIGEARRNFDRNRLSTTDARFVVADVFGFLADARAGRARWDLVISDPPSFAPSRRSLPDALRAYRRLHAQIAEVVDGGGILCAASCSSHVDEDAFLASIHAGCADAGRRFHLQKHHGAAEDHPVLAVFPEGRYLKFIVGTVT
jgi:23S rRNA (cytosine1962-C5)-methyltransferase